MSGINAPTSSGPTLHPGCDGQDHGDQKESVTHMDDDEAIRATNVAVGLGRVPSGFHAAVRHSGLEWRTPNRPVSVNGDAIEWRSPIPIPSDPSAIVRLGIYAPFEIQPTLGQAEALRELTITVQQLQDHSVRGLPIPFHLIDGSARSPRSSLLVTVQRRRRESGNSLASRVLDLHCSITEPRGELEEATNHGHSTLLRYRKHKETRDLERSIQLFELALDKCPLDHPCRAAAQSNLAMAKFARCQIDDSFSYDVSRAIDLYREALVARPAGHHDRPSTLIQLAAVHVAQFERYQEAADTAQAKVLLGQAMNLSSPESYRRQATISALQLHARPTGDSVQAGGPSSMVRDPGFRSTWSEDVQLLRRFGEFGDLADLQQAISILEVSISDSTQDPRYPVLLGNLGAALLCRFRHLGQLEDLEQAIHRQEDAVELALNDHPDLPGQLSNLGNSLLVRFEHLGNPNDLEQAILRHRALIDILSDGHPSKPCRLNNLGNSLLVRFEHLGGLDDLEQAISLFRRATELVDSDKPAYLNNLATSVFTRFMHLGELDDLEQAISVHLQVIDLTPDGHSSKPRRLSNLASSIVARFEQFGNLSDLEQAISGHRIAIALTPDGHPDQPRYLNNLANSFRARYECLGELNDLEQAISCQRKAMVLTGPDRINHCYANGLATSLLSRFKHLGEPDDLEGAISGHRKAIELTPDGNRSKPAYLHDIAMSLLTRFEWLGEPSDLKQAISGHQRATTLAGPDRTNHVYVNTIATSFLARFKHLGKPSDLEKAISGHQEAILLVRDSHRHKPAYLNDFATSLFTRFEYLGKPDDLEQGISRLREAVALCADCRSEKPDYLNNLGICLRTHFTHYGQPSDLEEAISRHREAIQLAPEDQTKKANYRKNIVSRFAHRRIQKSDLEQAVSTYKQAVRLNSNRHPDNLCRRLNDLANCLLVRFEHFGELSDLEEAALMHGNAVQLQNSSAPHSRSSQPSCTTFV